MKLKYRNITIPYRVCNDKKENYIYYIYNDKKYTDLNKLFTDFLGSYLTYHYEVKDKLKEVHNLSEVVEALLKNKADFKIPKKYKEEYSDSEYQYIFELQKKLLNEGLKIEDNSGIAPKYSKLGFITRKEFKFYKEIYDKYKNVKIPKKIHSNIFNHDYYVVAGRAYETVFGALSEVYNNEIYYQFGGTKNPNNRTHFHSHNFEDLISMIFDYSSNFKIHVFQREFYSKQELDFLSKLSDKLKAMKFHSAERKMNIDVEEYFYLKDNKKFFKLLVHNIKYILAENKYQKEKIKSHKI